MKVKVGDRVYDGEKEPVMVILSDEDKKNIQDMPNANTKYAVAPDGHFSKERFLEWMREGV